MDETGFEIGLPNAFSPSCLGLVCQKIRTMVLRAIVHDLHKRAFVFLNPGFIIIKGEDIDDTRKRRGLGASG